MAVDRGVLSDRSSPAAPEDVVEPDQNVIRLRIFADVLPPRLLGRHKRAGAEVLVRIIKRLGVFEVVALRTGNERSGVLSSPFLTKRKKAEKDNRQDVALVIRRLN